MLKNLTNLEGINWWTMLGGIGLNFIIWTLVAIFGAYLRLNEATAEFYVRFGPPVIVLVLFVACLAAGFIIGKVAGDHHLKHALWASLGIVGPFLFGAVTTFDPNSLMLAVVSLAGAMNGGMLSTPRPRHGPPQNRF